MTRIGLAFVGLLAIAAGCAQSPDKILPGALDITVDARVIPQQTTVPDESGAPLPVSSSVDAQGVKSDFVEGVVLVRPKSAVDLDNFLAMYEGTIVSDDSIPAPPANLGVQLTDDQRKATEYTVRVNLAKLNITDVSSAALAAGLSGEMRFSSQAGLQTFSVVVDAVSAGFDVSPDYISYPSQFPLTMLNTTERPNGAATFTDAFQTTRFQTTGSQSNVTTAWQYVAAHGVRQRTRVAIIDGGFLLNANGTPLGTDSDFPANPTQYDFVQDDYFADGANTMGCGAGNPCFWHGTGSTSVATGIINNRLGDAGTGGLIGDPMLFKIGGPRNQTNRAIRTAVAWGADVVSMSFGGDCNQACRIYDRDHTPIDDAVDSGSRTVFIAAAGNGRSTDGTNFVGYDVGDPSFVHPCIEDHVICVGALNNDATTKIGYSNFGARVTIFAPTNIPVMSQPVSTDNNPSGPSAPRNFGGTSASTPFVAGVAAMVKALNPAITSDQMAQLLQETAHVGVAPVNRYIDAYAAVRRAAIGFDPVIDRFEPNAEAFPTVLGVAGSYALNNLSTNPSDVDWYRFEAPAGSVMTLNLQYPTVLGSINVFRLESLNGTCAAPVLQSNVETPNQGRVVTYAIPGGPFLLALRGTDVNAYNLGITFASPTVAADSYEPNDTDATARYMYSFKPAGSGLLKYYAIDPGFSVNATLHNATDTDWYKVRGAPVTGALKFLLNGYPAIKVQGNDSPISMEVYSTNADGTRGALYAAASNGSCAAKALSVGLQENVYYYVRIFGTPGKYALYNGADGSPRKFPEWMTSPIHDILHPGDPIERYVRYPELQIFVADRRYTGIRTRAAGVHLELLDVEGKLLMGGLADLTGGEQIALNLTTPGQLYAVRMTPASAEDQLVSLSWDEAPAAHETANLLVNPGAETVVGEGDVPGWSVVDGLGMPRTFFYSDEGGVSPGSPGPQDRGYHLFSGGASIESGMEQIVAIEPAWRAIAQNGGARLQFSGYLGGYASEADHAVVELSFRGPNFEDLGTVTVPTVTPLERGNVTGLLPVALEETVPAGTFAIRVRVLFHGGEGESNDAYADNLEVKLVDY